MSKLKKILLVLIPLLAVLGLTTFFIVRSYQNSKTFTVTFDSNGGSEVEKQEVKLNEKVEEPEDPTRDGYKFKGWYLNGKKYDFDKKVTKDIKLKARWTKIAVEEVVTQPVVLTPVVSKKDATLKFETPEPFYVNREATFGLTVVANDYKDTMVVGVASVSEPEALEKLEYKGADDNWYELSLEESFGGEKGFALVDGTNEFRAVFNKIGEYEVKVQLLAVADKKVMAEAKITIKVERKNAELIMTAEEPFYLNDGTNVVVSVEANDDAGTKVIGKALISEPEALEKLEYKGADDNWYELSLEEDFGQSEGFELADGASEFKATFNKVGEYEVTIQLLNVEDNSVVAETKETINVELEPANLSFTILPELVVNREYEFTGEIEANDYVGKNVVGKVSVNMPEALEKLEYKGADNNWYELSLEEAFGGEEGFALADGTNDFKVTFNTVGEYEVTVQLINVEDESVVGESVLEISVREPIAPTIGFEVEEEFIVGFAKEFTISTEANDYKDLIVVGTGGLSNPEAIEKLEYYEVQDGNWYELPKDVDFGGSGFPLADATSRFRVTFKTAGTYTVEYAVVDAQTTEIVASNETEITVREAIDAEVSFEMPEEFVVGTAQEFTISTEANDYENLIVVGTGGLSNPEAIEKLEYYEVQDGNWYELPADSNFGGSGFELTDATSSFRVTFDTAGEYEVEFQILNAETSEVVAESQTTITVVDAIQSQA